MAQVVFVGAPLQDSDTLPLKPPTEVTVSVYVPELWRPTVKELGETETVKSETDCASVPEVLPEKFALVEAKTATTECVPAVNAFVE